MNMKKKILKFIFDLFWKSKCFREIVYKQFYDDVIYPKEQLLSEYQMKIVNLKTKLEEIQKNESIKPTITQKPKRKYTKKSN